MSQRKSTLVIYLLKKASHHFITIWSICVCATKLLLFMDPPHMLTCHFSKRAGISIKGYDLACSTRWPYPSHPSVTFTTQICSFLQKSSLEIESNCCARGSAKTHRSAQIRTQQNRVSVTFLQRLSILSFSWSMVNVPKVGQRTERGTIVDAIYEAIIQQSRWSNENLLIS